MKRVTRYTGLGLIGVFAFVAPLTVWVMAQDSGSESELDEPCEWKFVGNHTSTDAKGHFWNECTGELYYVVGTSAERANVNLE